MENECEALPGVAYPGVRDNRSTINTKTGYDDDDDAMRSVAYAAVQCWTVCLCVMFMYCIETSKQILILFSTICSSSF